MKHTFFKSDEDLKRIIESIIDRKDIKDIRKIPTGWTNIVIEVTTKTESYFFRFPRDDFWSKMIIKDYHFCEFIKGKTSFKTPEMNLYYDNNRPFSVHKKIEGFCLTEKLETLSKEAMETLAQDISKFIIELSSIDVQNLPEKCNISLFNFLDELANVHFENLSLWQKEYFLANDNDKYLVHGDLNPGNIIIDNNYRVIAIIDFCFAGTGNPYADISRIIGRSPHNFKKIMIETYEKKSNSKLDINILNKFTEIWTDIEKGYISYIKKNNPDIKLPDEV